MKLKIKFIQLMLVVITCIMTACSSFKNPVYKPQDKTCPSQYNIKNTKKFEEQQSIQIEKLQNNNVIYFPLDQYDVLNQFFSILDAHANFLYNHPLNQIKIEGHTDERGTPEYNIALGERRADAVKSYLQSKGVVSEQMFIVSYGKEKPAILGHNEQAYSKNRRVVLVHIN